jgi:DNA-nicking Smr family endonuclease
MDSVTIVNPQSGARHDNEHAKAVSPLAAAHEIQHEVDEEFCKEARAESEALYAKKSAKMAESKAAFERGDKAAAHELSAEGKALASAAEAAAATAARKIFAMKNARVGPLEVDLHGLHVAEALEFVRERLDHDNAQGAERPVGVVFIYGAGHHSAGGKQLLKPAVLSELAGRPKDQIVEYREDWDAVSGKANPGCVSVVYPGGSFEALRATAGSGGSNTPAPHAAQENQGKHAAGVAAPAASDKPGKHSHAAHGSVAVPLPAASPATAAASAANPPAPAAEGDGDQTVQLSISEFLTSPEGKSPGAAAAAAASTGSDEQRPANPAAAAAAPEKPRRSCVGEGSCCIVM